MYYDPEQKHPTTASVLVGIGATYQKQGKYALAIKTYDQALRIREEYYKNEPRSETANLLNIMGDLCEINTGITCLENSYFYYNRAYSIRKQLYEENNAELLNNQLKLGTSLLAQERHREYIPHFENFLKHTKQTNENEVIIANVEYGLGLGYKAINEPHKSIEHLKQSLDHWVSLKNHKYIIETANVLAKTYISIDKVIDAANIFIISLDEQLRLLENVPSTDTNNLENKALLLVKKGNAYQAKDENENSIKYYEEALKFYPDKANPNVSDTLSKIAEEYTKLGNLEASECYNDLIVKLAEGNDVELVGVCDKAITGYAEQEL